MVVVKGSSYTKYQGLGLQNVWEAIPKEAKDNFLPCHKDSNKKTTCEARKQMVHTRKGIMGFLLSSHVFKKMCPYVSDKLSQPNTQLNLCQK